MTATPARPRTMVYIDGFNLYYGAIKGGPFKWLDLDRYFRMLRPADELVRVHYFTAEVTGPTLANQRFYLRALATTPSVNIVLGRFKPKRFQCKVAGCRYAGDRSFTDQQEKRTDVNIALQILEDGYTDRCDQFVLVSGDSDLVPAVVRVKALFPSKRVFVYVPTRNPVRGAAVELRSSADKDRDLPLNLLKFAQFPRQVPDGAGGWITKPSGW